MSTYLHGTTVLGALGRIDEENIAITKKIDRRLITGILAGVAVLAPGLAFAWRTHRILGGVLGLLAGPVLGGGCGLLLSLRDLKKIKENRARRESAVVDAESVR